VVIAVVLDGQHQLFPPHIEVVLASTVHRDRDLCLRPRKARADNQQPKPRLSRRLSAAVVERKRSAELAYAARATIGICDLNDRRRREAGCASQRVETFDRLPEPAASADIKRSSADGGRRQSAP